MQQYRLNYPLLIGLAVGSVIASGAIYGLWRFQIERKSDVLLAEAEKAKKAGNHRGAAQYYSHYISIHGSDGDIRLKQAEAFADVLDHQDNVGMEDVGTAMRVLEATVREMPEAHDLQRRLVDLYGYVQRYQDALEHLNSMLARDPNNAELQALRAQYLVRSGNVNEAVTYSCKLIGYDPATDEFDDKKATTPQDIPVYSNLARLLRTQQDKPALADRVMEKLIERNPKSAPAYLVRGTYWIAADDKQRGQEDIETAYQLDPKDADVLLAMASQASTDKETDKARELLTKGKELHPDDPRFYQSFADLEASQGKYKEALAEIEDGLKKVGTKKGGILLFYKAGVQLQNKDVDGVRDTIRQMKQAGFRPEILDWHEMRILLVEEKFHEAAEALHRLQPRMSDMGDMATQIYFFLGMCYERMGQDELARQSYESVLMIDSKNEPAKLGLQRMLARLDPKKVEVADAQSQELDKELAKPKDKQDAAKINALVAAFAEKRKLDPFQIKMLQVPIALVRQDFATARSLLREADKLKPDNLQVYLSLVTVARLDPKVGPAKAMEMWEKMATDKRFGDSAEMRIAKADLLVALAGDQLKLELTSLLAGIDGWKPEQKVMLWRGIAQRFLNLGMMDEAKQALTLVADQLPNELPTRVGLFTLALETDDDDGMAAAQKKILEIVKDKGDSTYLFTEARRQLSNVRRGKLGREALPGIRQTINRALEMRPDWHELWLANAELEVFANNPDAALAHYAKAQKAGRPSPRSVAQHIRLLALVGRYQEASELLERIPEQLRQPMLENFYTEILFRTNKVDDAIREARTAAEAAPTDARKQFWHGQLLTRSTQMPGLTEEQRKTRTADAIVALRRTVELEPELPDAWFALISLNAQNGDQAAAQQALRDAQLSLAGDNLQLFLAHSYEVLGYWFDAQTMYRAFYEMDPADIGRARQLAQFYLGPYYQQPDAREKATPLLNQILKAGYEVADDDKPKLPPNDPNLLWARRTSAQMLAETKDYQNLKKAENLLASSSSQDGRMTVEDRLQMAQILASRPEPESRKKAARLLEEVAEVQQLNERAEVMLGQLYFISGEWAKCRTQMQNAIAHNEKSTVARESYIDMLLSRNDSQYHTEARRQLELLRKLAPNGRSTFTLSVRLANKLGMQKAARAELLRVLPKIDDPKKLTDDQAAFLGFLATLFIELKDLDNAEQIFQQLAARDPKLQFALAEFVGNHRDVAKCFELLKQAYTPNTVNEVLTVATNTIRNRRDEVGTRFDAQVDQWLERAKLENPDSISVLLLEADWLDVQKKYDEAAAVWRSLLTRSDLDGFRRAVVLNNLAFLIALAGPSADTGGLDPLKLIEEAEQILGPNADILDTKAVVLIQRQRYKEAIEELQLSVTDKPTGAKYFHMVVAYLGAGQKKDALDAWDQAEEAGLTREELNRMEHSRYDEVKAKIDGLRSGASSVSQN